MCGVCEKCKIPYGVMNWAKLVREWFDLQM